MKINNEDKIGINKVVKGELISYSFKEFYSLRNLEEYLEQIGVEYINDSSWKHVYTIDYARKNTNEVFILNGNEKTRVQIFEKDENL